MIAYVAQPNGYGCAIACCAMVLGKSYEEMEAWLVANGCALSRLEKGMHSEMWPEILGNHGYSWRRVYQADMLKNTRREAWPVPPFAPVHIAAVRVAGGSHAIVVLADGTVLDPYKRERTSLSHPDYLEVSSITGFYEVAA